MELDGRIRRRIEKISGLPFELFPDEGVRVRVSEARTNKPKNRLLAQRVIGKNGVLITGIPRVVEAVRECAESMTPWELFSPLGLAEMKRSLSPEDTAYLDETYSFEFALTETDKFHPVSSRYRVVPLRKKDIPPMQYNLRMAERRSFEVDDFIWAFACYHKDSAIPAKRLPEYGPQCASVAVILWQDDDVAGFGVGTEESLQGKGYALATVSAATQWILDQNAVAWYGAYANNTPSLRIARRLGFSLVYSSFVA